MKELSPMEFEKQMEEERIVQIIPCSRKVFQVTTNEGEPTNGWFEVDCIALLKNGELKYMLGNEDGSFEEVIVNNHLKLVFPTNMEKPAFT